VDRLLETLRKQRATVLVATHLIERTSPLCDQALVLEAGRLAWTGPAGDLISKGGVDVAGLPEGAA
jgi:ABC-type multidrug transport system ATPase subunit